MPKDRDSIALCGTVYFGLLNGQSAVTHAVRFHTQKGGSISRWASVNGYAGMCKWGRGEGSDECLGVFVFQTCIHGTAYFKQIWPIYFNRTFVAYMLKYLLEQIYFMFVYPHNIIVNNLWSTFPCMYVHMCGMLLAYVVALSLKFGDKFDVAVLSFTGR